jgi:hypothetical protein
MSAYTCCMWKKMERIHDQFPMWQKGEEWGKVRRTKGIFFICKRRKLGGWK